MILKLFANQQITFSLFLLLEDINTEIKHLLHPWLSNNITVSRILHKSIPKTPNGNKSGASLNFRAECVRRTCAIRSRDVPKRKKVFKNSESY